MAQNRDTIRGRQLTHSRIDPDGFIAGSTPTVRIIFWNIVDCPEWRNKRRDFLDAIRSNGFNADPLEYVKASVSKADRTTVPCTYEVDAPATPLALRRLDAMCDRFPDWHYAISVNGRIDPSGQGNGPDKVRNSPAKPRKRRKTNVVTFNPLVALDADKAATVALRGTEYRPLAGHSIAGIVTADSHGGASTVVSDSTGPILLIHRPTTPATPLAIDPPALPGRVFTVTGVFNAPAQFTC